MCVGKKVKFQLLLGEIKAASEPRAYVNPTHPKDSSAKAKPQRRARVPEASATKFVTRFTSTFELLPFTWAG